MEMKMSRLIQNTMQITRFVQLLWIKDRYTCFILFSSTKIALLYLTQGMILNTQ